jgi:hypothetical protein
MTSALSRTSSLKRKPPAVSSQALATPPSPGSTHGHLLPGRPAAIPARSEAETQRASPLSVHNLALPLQRKLAVGAASSPFEDEANHFAEQVMQMPSPQLGGGHTANSIRANATSPRPGSQGTQLQTKRPDNSSVGTVEAPPIVHDVLHSPGRPLDESTRAFMEPRFGTGLGDVRVHTDARAAESAQAVGAHAYTVNRDMVFAEGQYEPGTDRGTRLLAHELTHVMQQASTQNAATPQVMREPNGQDPDNELKPYKVEGTPFTVIPLEPAQGGETVNILGYHLPFRSVRITNENEVTPLPKLPQHWKQAPDTIHVKPGAASKIINHFTGGIPDLQLPDLVGVDPAPPEQPPGTVPRFVITVRSDGAGIDVLDRVLTTLYPDIVPGTPLHGSIGEDYRRRDELIDPSVSFDKGGKVFAAGTVSLRDPYPRHYVDPTEVSVEAHANINPKEESDELKLGTGSVRVNALGIAGAKEEVEGFIEKSRLNAALAPLGLDEKEGEVVIHEVVVKLKEKIDALSANPSLQGIIDGALSLENSDALRKELEQVIAGHIKPGTKPAVVEHAADEIVSEITHPGFSLHGPIYFGIPIGYGSFRADTTRHLRKPFEGSAIGTPFPATLVTAGPAYIPPGVLSSIGTPALGATVARDFESLALSGTIAARPYLDTGVIGAAGVATGRIGFRVKGFDVVIEGGFRGQVPLIGGASSSNTNPFLAGVSELEQAKQDAQENYNENVKKDERGFATPDLKPAEILPDSRPTSEFYGSFHITRKF